uniref:Uncharacterized protein n=1 Tax=Anguilla anguilla TaxID=7936 RepID=A0A0E9VIE0_ANGAN
MFLIFLFNILPSRSFSQTSLKSCCDLHSYLPILWLNVLRDFIF